MKGRYLRYPIWLILPGIVIAGCIVSPMDEAMQQTQIALAVQQTNLAEDIQFLTQDAASQEQESVALPIITVTQFEEAENQVDENPPTPTAKDTEIPAPSRTPRPSNTPRPVKPMLYADVAYFCRQGPSKYTEPHWTFSQGQSAPIIGKSENGWWLISVSAPDTRTECCWVGGGVPSGNLGSLPTITEEIDRINCPNYP